MVCMRALRARACVVRRSIGPGTRALQHVPEGRARGGRPQGNATIGANGWDSARLRFGGVGRVGTPGPVGLAGPASGRKAASFVQLVDRHALVQTGALVDGAMEVDLKRDVPASGASTEWGTTSGVCTQSLLCG